MSTSLSGMNGFKGPTGSSSSLRGTGYKNVTMPNFTPEQFSLFKSLFSNLDSNSQLSKLAGGDQSQFGQLEKPALQQFNSLQGNLASRFSGMGMGARRSSGFQNSSNQATQDFASQLQSQRMGIQQQAMKDLMGMSSQLLGQRPYENALLPEKRPFWQEMALTGLEGFGHLAGSWAGNR